MALHFTKSERQQAYNVFIAIFYKEKTYRILKQLDTNPDFNLKDTVLTPMTDSFFKYQNRLNVLQIDVRIRAMKYAESIYKKNRCSKEEALEKGIVKAEMEIRDL